MNADLVTFLTAFLGSAVESVEALTIVLAVGLSRGWRSPLYGTLTALALLTILVATLGRLLTTVVPEATLKLVIGTLVLMFGLRWLQKAILRSAKVIALHDENEEFRETERELAGARQRRGMDWTAFVISFKGVFLEGLEVAFIVFAVGAAGRRLAVAAVGGVVAMIAVAAVGIQVHRPLARVPENMLKFAVGILLSSLGTFWASEGMGVHWPGDFLSVFLVGGLYILASRAAVRALQPGHLLSFAWERAS